MSSLVILSLPSRTILSLFLPGSQFHHYALMWSKDEFCYWLQVFPHLMGCDVEVAQNVGQQHFLLIHGKPLAWKAWNMAETLCHNCNRVHCFLFFGTLPTTCQGEDVNIVKTAVSLSHTFNNNVLWCHRQWCYPAHCVDYTRLIIELQLENPSHISLLAAHVPDPHTCSTHMIYLPMQFLGPAEKGT